MTMIQAPPPAPREADLQTVYDAIVVGSGAAGGMAAHVMTSRGMKVLMLEAGKRLDINKELKSTEWPWQHPRRGEMPPGHHPLSLNEYTIRQPPYAADTKFKSVYSYVQGWGFSDYSKNIVVDEKDHPYSGTGYAWVRARLLGGKTNIWGRLALRLSDYDFKAKSRDGYGEDWPISYKDIEPYYDRVDQYLGISGVKENLPYLPDSLFQRPTRLAPPEVLLRNSLKKMNRVLTPYRAGVTTDGLKHNKYRSRCFGRGACNRRVGGCDIHAAFDSPTGLIYPAMDTGNLTLRTNAVCREVLVDPKTGKARGVAFTDAETGQSYEAKAKVVVIAASTLESARLMLLSKSSTYPNGIGNSSGHVGHNFCEHVMGPGVTGLVKDLVGKPRTLDDGRPGGFYVPRFRNLADKNRISCAATGSRARAPRTCFRTTRARRPVSARRSRSRCAIAPAPTSTWAVSAKCSRGTRTTSTSIRRSKTSGASRSSGSTTSSATTKRRCARTWPTRRRRCSRPRASRSSKSRSACSRKGGPSMSSGRRAWAAIRRPPS
jgi:hypothetical protein